MSGQRSRRIGVLLLPMVYLGLGISSAVDVEPKEVLLPSEIVPQWGVVGEIGDLRTVFITPDGLRDKYFVAQVLQLVTAGVAPGHAVQVMIFDEKRHTPRILPIRDGQLLHLRARYRREAGGKVEHFVWVSVVDARSSPPRLKETEAKIRPGHVE